MSTKVFRQLPRLRLSLPLLQPRSLVHPRFYTVTKREPVDVLTRRDNLLMTHGDDLYPLMEYDSRTDGRVLRHAEFLAQYGPRLEREQRTEDVVTIRGRIRSLRDLSSKLVFFDVVQDGRKLQGVNSYYKIGGDVKDFSDRVRALRVGDIVSVTGHPGRSATGELSLYATAHPKLLAPCLHPIPDSLTNPEKIKHHRHLDLLVHQNAAQTLRLRGRILKLIRNTLTNQDFTEVQTPILAASAGGAIARPFLTSLTSFSPHSSDAPSDSQQLVLRIAPELWLKRLLIGGLDRVFELGPSFRNEGLDATHNPEFTTCEAYMAFGRLDDLLTLTENLFHDVGRLCQQLKTPLGICHALEPLDADIAAAFDRPFRRLEFIPALEYELGEDLPDLESASAEPALRALCTRHKITVDASAGVAKMLDKLAGRFLEPLCYLPTFIMFHPACMSPLAKSTLRRGRHVSCRFEMFVQGTELVNAYEEENAPDEQRAKFRQQQLLQQRGDAAGQTPVDPEAHPLDEAYCAALEWGMPPTAGWGLGVDRMIMLFSGQDRIGDVMAFGGLRGAINQGIERPQKDDDAREKDRERRETERRRKREEGWKKTKGERKKAEEERKKGAGEEKAEAEAQGHKLDLSDIFEDLTDALGRGVAEGCGTKNDGLPKPKAMQEEAILSELRELGASNASEPLAGSDDKAVRVDEKEHEASVLNHPTKGEGHLQQKHQCKSRPAR